MREPIVKIYKNQGNGGNGAFTISTTASTPEEFLEETAGLVTSVVAATLGDDTFTWDHLLPMICEIWAKLKGYKAERVFEQRLLVMGEPNPGEETMLLNDADPSIMLKFAFAPDGETVA